MKETVLTNTGGIPLILQAADFGVITGLNATNFKILASGVRKPFTICNDSDSAVELEVIPAASTTDTFVQKRFLPGDNSYIVKEVKVNATLNKLIWARQT